MGLYNHTLAQCPFTGVDVNGAGDPSPGLDGISYYGSFLGHPFPIKLHYADKWAEDSWLKENGPRFIEQLSAEDQLDTFFEAGKTLEQVRRAFRG